MNRSAMKPIPWLLEGSETTCDVVDYDKNGVVTGFSTQCVKEGTACPCGKNTISCPDPNDVTWKKGRLKMQPLVMTDMAMENGHL